MGRNTALLQGIVAVIDTQLDDPEHALDQLESRFEARLLVNAGNVFTSGEYAEQLRLRITEDERSGILDYIAEKQMVMVNINTVEDAINERFGWDRFIES